MGWVKKVSSGTGYCRGEVGFVCAVLSVKKERMKEVAAVSEQKRGPLGPAPEAVAKLRALGRRASGEGKSPAKRAELCDGL